MSFLSPLFLLGVFAIAGPIVFHLIRRATREKNPVQLVDVPSALATQADA